MESICLRKVSANLTGLSEQYFYPKKTIEEKNLAAFSHAIRLLGHLAILFNGPLSLRLVATVGARRGARSQWVLSKTRTYTQDLSVLSAKQFSH